MDFLANFNFSADEPTASKNIRCVAIEELQLQLGASLEQKVTPTRAEHFQTTLELTAQSLITLSLSESEHDALEGLSNVDPSLGGARSTSVPGEHGARTVVASDAITNQPDNDPVLQKSIARHIADAIGRVDESSWAVTEVSRGAQGWEFGYMCKHSLKCWNRQTKSQAKMLMGEYTQKELDPVMMSTFTQPFLLVAAPPPWSRHWIHAC